jgi:hypothetical protein
MGAVATPTDVTADGGGITLKGTTDKTINWVDATDAWTLSEHVNIANGKEYRINGAKVLDATSLGSSVLITSANITDGTIVNGDVNASAAIAGTKISPDFGSQNVTTTGTATAAALIPSGSSVPTNGVYLSAANSVSIATNSTQRLLIDAAGQIEAVSLGSAAAPTFSWTGDPNTGIYSPGADQVALSTNGTERMRLDSSGRLGLGTSSPAALFHAAGAGLFRASITGTAATLPAESSFVSILNGTAYNGIPSVSLNIGAHNYDATDATKPFQWRITTPSTASDGASLQFSTYEISNWTGGTYTTTSRLTINSSGNVGIGTASPGSKLQVRGGISGTNILVDSITSTDYTYFNAKNASGVDCQLAANGNSEARLVVTSNHNLAFYTNNQRRADIDSSGRLLVGTSTEIWGNRFEVVQTANNGNIGALRYTANTSGSEFNFIKSRGATAGTNTIVVDGDDLARINFKGADGSTYVDAARITAQVDGTPGTNSMPGRIVLSTTPSGSASPVERMRIAQNGVITIQNGAVAVIGTLTDGATITPDFAADCNFTVTLGGARTIANPTNITAGQSGSIFLVQDATGSRTAAWGSFWDFPGGTAPTLSTAANAVDRVDYIVRSSTSIHTVFTANYS